MKLAPGTPLPIGLVLDEDETPAPVGRVAMADGLAISNGWGMLSSGIAGSTRCPIRRNPAFMRREAGRSKGCTASSPTACLMLGDIR